MARLSWRNGSYAILNFRLKPSWTNQYGGEPGDYECQRSKGPKLCLLYDCIFNLCVCALSPFPMAHGHTQFNYRSCCVSKCPGVNLVCCQGHRKGFKNTCPQPVHTRRPRSASKSASRSYRYAVQRIIHGNCWCIDDGFSVVASCQNNYIELKLM